MALDPETQAEFDQATAQTLDPKSPKGQFVKEKVEHHSAQLKEVRKEIAKVIKGMDREIELALISMVADGHALFEGAPGLAKSTLVTCIAKAMNLESKRIQFTPDLMPSDIIGAEVMEEDTHLDEQGREKKKKHFDFIEGPVFTQLLMADEINRASSKTQSALLGAMQDGYVSVNGEKRDLPAPFNVLATQNPLEQEGTYPLPEAQLDRFVTKIPFDYPAQDEELLLMYTTTAAKDDIMELYNRSAEGEIFKSSKQVRLDSRKLPCKEVLGPNDLLLMQRLATQLPVNKNVAEAALKLVRGTRPDQKDAKDKLTIKVDSNASLTVDDLVSWGASPRAAQAFMRCIRARALLHNRLAPDMSDVQFLAMPILGHRMGLTFAAKAESVDNKQINEQMIVDRLVQKI